MPLPPSAPPLLLPRRLDAGLDCGLADRCGDLWDAVLPVSWPDSGLELDVADRRDACFGRTAAVTLGLEPGRPGVGSVVPPGDLPGECPSGLLGLLPNAGVGLVAHAK